MGTVRVEINLPPDAQYARGHALTVEGATGAEVSEILRGLVPGAQDGVGDTILRRFVETGLLGAVREEMKTETSSGATDVNVANTAPVEAAPPAAAPDEERASSVLLSVVAKKTGRDVNELRGLSKAEAQALLKEVK